MIFEHHIARVTGASDADLARCLDQLKNEQGLDLLSMTLAMQPEDTLSPDMLAEWQRSLHNGQRGNGARLLGQKQLVPVWICVLRRQAAAAESAGHLMPE